MRLFHAHIYFDEKQTPQAEELFTKISRVPQIRFFKIYDRPIGPHSKAMIEVHFLEVDLVKVQPWLDQQRGDLSILIHEETGNDVRDHSEKIMWLGSPVFIDFEFFELIKMHPELKIHKD